MRLCPYKDAFSSLCRGPPSPPSTTFLPPCASLGAEAGQQRTPAPGPRSRNGAQFHHNLIKIDRKYTLLLNFYYYYFYPPGSHVSSKLVLIKHRVLPAGFLQWVLTDASGSWCRPSPQGAGVPQREEGLQVRECAWFDSKT